MSDHTKSEWKLPINQDLMNEIYAKDETNIFNPNALRLIARVEKFKHVDPKSEEFKRLDREWRGNAKLMCAAPKLLSALETLVANLPVPEEGATGPLLDAANAAKAVLDTLK